MKKFIHLAIGDTFHFQGEDYSKTGPLTATGLSDNRQRMIPRSAMVRPLQSGAELPTTDNPAVTLDGARVLEAFEHYHAGCLEWLRLAEQELSAEHSVQIRLAMTQARERLLSDLGLTNH